MLSDNRLISVDIVLGERLEFRPASLGLRQGTIVVWTNRTNHVQTFKVQGREVQLAPNATEGAVAMTRFAKTGHYSCYLSSDCAATIRIKVSS